MRHTMALVPQLRSVISWDGTEPQQFSTIFEGQCAMVLLGRRRDSLFSAPLIATCSFNPSLSDRRERIVLCVSVDRFGVVSLVREASRSFQYSFTSVGWKSDSPDKSTVLAAQW